MSSRNYQYVKLPLMVLESLGGRLNDAALGSTTTLSVGYAHTVNAAVELM